MRYIFGLALLSLAIFTSYVIGYITPIYFIEKKTIIDLPILGMVALDILGWVALGAAVYFNRLSARLAPANWWFWLADLGGSLYAAYRVLPTWNKYIGENPIPWSNLWALMHDQILISLIAAWVIWDLGFNQLHTLKRIAARAGWGTAPANSPEALDMPTGSTLKMFLGAVVGVLLVLAVFLGTGVIEFKRADVDLVKERVATHLKSLKLPGVDVQMPPAERAGEKGPPDPVPAPIEKPAVLPPAPVEKPAEVKPDQPAPPMVKTEKPTQLAPEPQVPVQKPPVLEQPTSPPVVKPSEEAPPPVAPAVQSPVIQPPAPPAPVQQPQPPSREGCSIAPNNMGVCN
ncbi:MAG: hypothetical protein HYS26_04345 [Candidatus Kaiserbacteria bacterium]|nr:MAG: hypothetical protein HYS26_04345 [Candidatus Kaiserbacteria bacterium]